MDIALDTGLAYWAMGRVNSNLGGQGNVSLEITEADVNRLRTELDRNAESQLEDQAVGSLVIA